MKKIVFDASTIISLADNCMLWVLEALKEKHSLELLIPPAVEFESVSRPEKIEKYHLNALRIEQAVNNETLRVVPSTPELGKKTKKILSLANNSFFIGDKPLTLLHQGEAEVLAVIGLTDADVLAVDERNARMILENPERLRKHVSSRLGVNVSKNDKALRDLKREVGDFKVVRSTELLSHAYREGLLNMTGVKPRQALKAGLHAMKYNGCSVTFKEIQDYLKEEKL